MSRFICLLKYLFLLRVRVISVSIRVRVRVRLGLSANLDLKCAVACAASSAFGAFITCSTKDQASIISLGRSVTCDIYLVLVKYRRKSMINVTCL